MPTTFEGGQYLTVAEAVKYMGCTDGWIRLLLRDGKIPGAKRLGDRLWLIPVSAAREARDELSTRSTGKRHKAKRPAASRKKAKRKKA